jgi:hypothetical protein
MSEHGVPESGGPSRGGEVLDRQTADREIAARRAGLTASLAEARGALRHDTGWRSVAGWTGPLLAAGLGLVSALAIRRFLRR